MYVQVFLKQIPAGFLQEAPIRSQNENVYDKTDQLKGSLYTLSDKIFTSSRPKSKLIRKRPSSEPDKSKTPSKLPRTSVKEELSKSVGDGNVKVADKSMDVEEKAIATIEADSHKDSHSGLYALNPLLTRSLEAELQDVMIKVWQVFPDETDSAAEALVAEKFRNQAGDDLRNMLGLNVTQRLLNIFNPLYVKLTFSSPPKQDLFKAFLKKYNITSYKELDSRGLTYLARAKDIATFDSLCNGNQKASGNTKVTVQPCYRFNGCPANLECTFSKQVSAKTKTSEINVKDAKAKQNKLNATENLNPDKDVIKKQGNTPNVQKTGVHVAKVSKVSVETKAKNPVPKQSVTNPVTKADQIKTAAKKVSDAVPKTSLAKTVPPKPEVTTVKQEPKTPQRKPTSNPLQKATVATSVKTTPPKPKQDSVKTEPKTVATKPAAKVEPPTSVTKTGKIATNASTPTIKSASTIETPQNIQNKATPKTKPPSAAKTPASVTKLGNIQKDASPKTTLASAAKTPTSVTKPGNIQNNASPKTKPASAAKTPVSVTKPGNIQNDANPKTTPASANKAPLSVTKPGNIQKNASPAGTATGKAAQTKPLAKAQPKPAPKLESNPITPTQDKIVPKLATENACKAKAEESKPKIVPKTQITPKLASNTNTTNKGKISITTKEMNTKNVKTVSPKKKSPLKPVSKAPPNKKPVTKTNPKSKLALQNKYDDIEDDDEELNDEEILKLLGGGIVLDECSGSDLE